MRHPKESNRNALLVCLLILALAVSLGVTQCTTATAAKSSASPKFRAQYEKACKQRDHYHLCYLARKRWWTKREIRFVATQAADSRHVSSTLTTWAIAACVQTATHEAAKRKRHGHIEYDTHSLNRSHHAGLHQWARSWHGTRAQKFNGVWSCKRFMKVVVDGGQAKVRQHWAQTIGAL